MISHHSSRVFCAKISRSRSFHRRPLGAVHLSRQVLSGEARLLHQFGVELRLDRTDRNVLPVLRLVDLVEVRSGVEHVGAALLAPPAGLLRAVDDRHQRRHPVHHRGVDHLPLAGRGALDQGAHDPVGHQHAAAAEVADQIEGRQRRLAGPTDVRQDAGQGDVVDVVAGGVGQGPVLAPARHARVDEARVALEADVGAETQPLHYARAEALDQHVGLLDQTKQSPRHRRDASGRVRRCDGRGPGNRGTACRWAACPRAGSGRRAPRPLPCPTASWFRTGRGRCPGPRESSHRRGDPPHTPPGFDRRTSIPQLISWSVDPLVALARKPTPE